MFVAFDLFGNKDDKPKRRRVLSHQYDKILQNQMYKCAECPTKLTDHPKNYHIDHIKPLADGGKDVLSNMQALCGTCHTKKSHLESGKRAEKRRKENVKEKDPFVDMFGAPKTRSKKVKDPFDIDLGLTPKKGRKAKDPLDELLGPSKKKKKKDPFSLF